MVIAGILISQNVSFRAVMVAELWPETLRQKLFHKIIVRFSFHKKGNQIVEQFHFIMRQVYVYMYRMLPPNDSYLKYLENLCWLAGICGRHQAVILVYLLIPWENDGHRGNFYCPKFQLRGCHGCRVMARNVETENAPQNNLVISHRMRECRDAALGFQCAWV